VQGIEAGGEPVAWIPDGGFLTSSERPKRLALSTNGATVVSTVEAPGLNSVVIYAQSSGGKTTQSLFAGSVYAPVTLKNNRVAYVAGGAETCAATINTFDSNAPVRSQSFGGCNTSSRIGTAAGADNRLYWLGDSGDIFSMDQDGVDGQSPTKFAVTDSRAFDPNLFGTAVERFGAPTISCNYTNPTSNTGVLAVTSNTGWLATYLIEAKGLDPTAPWPKDLHDERNSGNISFPVKRCP
jgi:hypothetical protein